MGKLLLRSLLKVAGLAFILAWIFAFNASASTYKIIYSFHGTPDGYFPIGDMVMDAAGNLYGVTASGTIFKLTQDAAGTWTETVLYSLPGGTSGEQPQGGVILDAAGNLYGTASSGGDPNCHHSFCGVVFELTSASDGTWKETVLHSFTGPDGQDPAASLVFDSAGNLYGTTYEGGFGFGTVFELSPNGGGNWTYTVLHSFGHPNDGAHPNSPLVFDRVGNLYGVTTQGGLGCNSNGNDGCGTVFELSPQSGGGWSYRVLHRFDGTHGVLPTGLALDAAGDLFGATSGGGSGNCSGVIFNGCGVAFELSPTSGGNFQGRIIRNYSVGAQQPNRVLVDSNGTIYGGTFFGGHRACNQNLQTCGTVYQLTPAGSGYTFSALHAFLGGADGQGPVGGLTRDAAGNLFGNTFLGGDLNCGVTGGCGVVFQIVP